MKEHYSIFFVFMFLLMFLTGCAGLQENKISCSKQPGFQTEQAFEKKLSKTLAIDYLLYLPQGYGRTEQKWPLILFLHGAGERGKDLNKVKEHGPPKIVDQGKALPFVIVSPQCPEELWWTDEVEVLINLLDEIESSYAIDTQRVYLTGLSMGGFGTWALASKYPERFAAIAPICGGGEPFSTRRLKNVPVWVFHGADDPLVSLERSEEMVEMAKKMGVDIKFTVYPDIGHDSWTRTYDNQRLYDWFLEHRKK
jgi:predicted peptidase